MQNFYARIFYLMLLLPLCVVDISAQDIHFSQFGNVPLNLNPGLTGAFAGDYRFRANYRNQWNNIVPYNTLSVSAEKNWSTPECSRGNCWRPRGFAAGLLFNYDVAGDGNLSLTQLALTGSYTMCLSDNLFLSAGLMLGGGQRRFNSLDLVFDSQYDGRQLNRALAANEEFDNDTKFLFDLSTGANFHYQDCGSRTAIDFGVGAFHINRPAANFFDIQDERLATRFSLYALTVFEIQDNYDILFNGLAQFQGPYQEYVFGPGVRLYTAPKKLPGKLIIDLGVSYRWEDAFVGIVNFNYQNWLFGASFDLNTSGFNRATNGYGGLEFSLGYQISNPRRKKVCVRKF
jgi:type IX secretion system PorP/SprF family membrane protein